MPVTNSKKTGEWETEKQKENKEIDYVFLLCHINIFAVSGYRDFIVLRRKLIILDMRLSYILLSSSISTRCKGCHIACYSQKKTKNTRKGNENHTKSTLERQW